MQKKGSKTLKRATVLVLAAVMAMMMASMAVVFADEAKAAPEMTDGVKMTGRPNAATKQADVTLALDGATDEWMKAVTEVTIDGAAVPEREAATQVDVEDSTDKADITKFGIVKIGTGDSAEYSLVVATSVFNKTPRRSNTYKVVIKADGYKDLEHDVTVTSYGAAKLYVRELDKDGKVLKTKAYTMDEYEKLAAYKKDVLYQGICSHHGIRGFRANGLTITDLLKDAGIEFKSGDELRLRTNDADTAETVNDNEAKDNYYCEGGFSYDYLYKPRYIFTDIYQDVNKDLYDKLVALQGTTTKIVTGKDEQGQDIVTTFHNYLNKDMRALLATGKKQEVVPFLASEMYENDLDDPEAPGTNYGTTRENYGFRFFYGMALDEEGNVEKDETNMRVSYYVYGIDIQHDTIEHAIDRAALDEEVQKAWALNEEDYTAESWAAFLPAFQNASKLVYVEGLNQNIKEHAKTTQAYINQRLEELKAAEAALVKKAPAKPAKTKITKAKAAKKAVTLTWKKVTKNCTGYEIRYSLKKNMKKAKTIKISKAKTSSKKVTKLKSKKKYYFQIRTVNKANGQTATSAWSAKKTAKAK